MKFARDVHGTASIFVMVVLGLLLSSVNGDELLFRNGDRLTGTIVKMDGGKLVFAAKVAGEVTVDLADIKTFSSEKPLVLHFTDQTVINQRADPAGDGSFAITQEGVLQAQVFSLTSLAAINPPPPPPIQWHGSVTAGAILTRGNSRTDSVNVGFEAARRTDTDRLSLQGGYLLGRQEDKATGNEITTQDTWNVAGKYDYFFSKKLFGYATVKMERDRVARLDLRLTPGLGVGYQWLESPAANFATEAGATWVTEHYLDPDETRDHMAIRLAYHFDKKINDKLKLVNNVEFLPSLEKLDSYLINADLGLRADLVKTLFGEVKIVYNYNSQPAPNTEKEDIKYILSLGWGF